MAAATAAPVRRRKPKAVVQDTDSHNPWQVNAEIRRTWPKGRHWTEDQNATLDKDCCSILGKLKGKVFIDDLAKTLGEVDPARITRHCSSWRRHNQLDALPVDAPKGKEPPAYDDSDDLDAKRPRRRVPIQFGKSKKQIKESGETRISEAGTWDTTVGKSADDLQTLAHAGNEPVKHDAWSDRDHRLRLAAIEDAARIDDVVQAKLDAAASTTAEMIAAAEAAEHRAKVADEEAESDRAIAERIEANRLRRLANLTAYQARDFNRMPWPLDTPKPAPLGNFVRKRRNAN